MIDASNFDELVDMDAMLVEAKLTFPEFYQIVFEHTERSAWEWAVIISVSPTNHVRAGGQSVREAFDNAIEFGVKKWTIIQASI